MHLFGITIRDLKMTSNCILNTASDTVGSGCSDSAGWQSPDNSDKRVRWTTEYFLSLVEADALGTAPGLDTTGVRKPLKALPPRIEAMSEKNGGRSLS